MRGIGHMIVVGDDKFRVFSSELDCCLFLARYRELECGGCCPWVDGPLGVSDYDWAGLK